VLLACADLALRVVYTHRWACFGILPLPRYADEFSVGILPAQRLSKN